VVFDAGTGNDASIAGSIEAALKAKHNLDVAVVVRSWEELAAIVAGNPYADQAAENYKTVHVSFLGKKPAPDLVAALAEVERGDDEYRVVGKDIYLHYPHGLGKATFMLNGFDKALKVTSTSRNWRTVVTLTEMTEQV
jgi:uncharacterized protein (DUF1697 family)